MNLRSACAVAALTVLFGVPVKADIVSFSLELNSGGSPKITIDNRSDPQWSMGSVIFDFTATNIVLDTTAGDGTGTDPVDQALNFLPVGTYGSFATAITASGLASYANSGNVAGLALNINTTGVAGCLMTFNFTGAGMTSGNGWGVNVDFDKLTGNSAPRGADINGTVVTANFFHASNPQNTFSLSYTFSGHGGNGLSFPVLAITNSVPEPATAGGLSLLVMAAGLIRRRRV